MLESGVVKSLRELARREGVDSSYVSRMVNLITLAPDIVATILDETLPPDVTLFEIAVDQPRVWEEQRARLADRKRFRRQNKGFGHIIHYPMLTPNS